MGPAPFPGMVRVTLCASRLVAVVLAAAHAACAASMLLLPLPALAGILLGVGMAVSLALGLRREAWRLNGQAIARVDLDGRGQLLLILKNGKRRSGTLLPGSFAAPFLVVLRYRSPGTRLARYCAIPRDGTDADSHRILRVLLRHPL